MLVLLFLAEMCETAEREPSSFLWQQHHCAMKISTAGVYGAQSNLLLFLVIGQSSTSELQLYWNRTSQAEPHLKMQI